MKAIAGHYLGGPLAPHGDEKQLSNSTTSLPGGAAPPFNLDRSVAQGS
jgi:hypothetical protein